MRLCSICLSPSDTFHWACLSQLCPALYDPMDCSPPGSSVHGILQARILEWVAISFSRGSSRPRDRTQVSCIAGRFFTIWATIIPPKSICAIADGGVSFFMAEQYSIVCICLCISYLLYPFFYWWAFGLLPHIGYCNNTVNIGVQVFFLFSVFVFFG